MEKAAREAKPLHLAARSDVRSLQLKYLPGVGPRRAELLERLGLRTVEDLFGHFPRRYEDRRNLRRIKDAVPGEAQVFYGRLESVRERALRWGKSLLEAELVDAEPLDDSGGLFEGKLPARVQLVWFNQPYLTKWIQPGALLHAYGQVKRRQGRLQMLSPEFELDLAADDVGGDPSPHVNRIVPVYSLTRGIQQRFLRGLVYRALGEDVRLGTGPQDILRPGGATALQALRWIHFPETWEDIAKARSRFIFEEYFYFATQLHFRRLRARQAMREGFCITEELNAKIRSIFPFRFTPEQDRVVSEIARDLKAAHPMYRLLQGDVGTGKTAVALYAMLVAVRNRHQAALMAPTEILAEQHYRTISRYLSRHPVRLGLLTSSVKGTERKKLLEDLSAGKVHVIVGTHALLQPRVSFKKLGLIVIDEQHRFGVKERMRLRCKGEHPHILVMTATPIPRSLCLTCYGDLDVSTIRERPLGRQSVKTYLVTQKSRPKAMEFLRGELAKGRQAYFVYPLIEESETLSLPAAKKAHQHLSRQVFPGLGVGLIHGKLPSAEKERELSRFRSGEYKVLVATVVVEVGIDVPNATVLFIEDASRFGLAQLHQLRGRVGRGSHAGYCLVGADAASREAQARLRAFASTEDGFKIAEEDLKIRGPGDYLGERQAGRPIFALGNPLEDLDEFLAVKAQAEAFWSRREHQRYLTEWAAPLGDLSSEVSDPEGFVGLD
jgi:ATP-dependent DNA helicase RecG